MEEILILLLQGLAELLLQILGSGMLDFCGWWADGLDGTLSRAWMTTFGLFVAGCAMGGLSLWLMPHSLLPWAWLRIVNVVLGPVSSGWISWMFATWRAQRHRNVVPWHHAVGAAAACLGVVLIRFTWGIRG